MERDELEASPNYLTPGLDIQDLGNIPEDIQPLIYIKALYILMVSTDSSENLKTKLKLAAWYFFFLALGLELYPHCVGT